MARVTVEDCLEHVENRFKLVLLASKRARQLSMGTEPLVEWENDKPTVVALREIEEGLVDEEMMEAALAQPVDDDLPFDEDDLAAALHAEISRELTQPAPEGQIASQSTSTSPSSLLAAPAANPFGNSPEPSEAPASEASSMESLLAQELAAAKTDPTQRHYQKRHKKRHQSLRKKLHQKYHKKHRRQYRRIHLHHQQIRPPQMITASRLLARIRMRINSLNTGDCL